MCRIVALIGGGHRRPSKVQSTGKQHITIIVALDHDNSNVARMAQHKLPTTTNTKPPPHAHSSEAALCLPQMVPEIVMMLPCFAIRVWWRVGKVR